jgi:MFS transporter, OPA family, glycerol-3-phosphate transporter
MPHHEVHMDREVAARFEQAQWRMLLATMFCYVFFYTGRQTFGFAIPGINEELGISKTQLGWISTAMLWSYAVGQAINGNLGDKFGGRRMMSLGAFVSCGLNWVVSFSQGVVGLLIPWAANGYAQSMAWAPGSRLLANWWEPIKRGQVYGLYVFAAGSSSVLAYVTSALILEFDLGWRYIFRIPVLLLLVGGAVYYLLVRDRPEELGFAPLNVPDPSEDQPSENDAAEPGDGDESAESPAGPEVEEETSWDRYTSALSNPMFLAACFAIGFQSLARYGLIIWVPVHFLGDDWKTSDGKWISIALPIGMALGAIASGWISDRLYGSNRSRVIGLFMFLAAVCTLTMLFIPRHHPGAIPMLFLAGFFAYGPQSAFWALCPDLLGHQRAGTATGVMNTFAYVFAGLGEPFIGWMIERNENTAVVFAIVAAACLLSAMASPLIKR